MQNKQWHILFLLIITLPSTSFAADVKHKQHTVGNNLLIIESNGKKSPYYRNFMLMARAVGYEVSYQNFYEFLEEPQIDLYHNIIFILSESLLKNLQTPLGQKFFKKIQTYARAGNHNMMIVLPSVSFSSTIDNVLASLHLFPEQHPHAHLVQETVTTFLHNILRHDAVAGRTFGTTLLTKKEQSPPQAMPLPPRAVRPYVTLLPVQQSHLSPRVAQLQPSALVIRNPTTSTRFLIAKASTFIFSDLEENFFMTPFNLQERNQLLMASQQILWEWFNETVHNVRPQSLTQPCPTLPPQLSPEYCLHEKQRIQHQRCKRMMHNATYRWLCTEPVRAAWLEPSDYFLHDDTAARAIMLKHPDIDKAQKAAALSRGVIFMYHADLNLLWFEFNPEEYLSDHGRKKDQRAQFIERTTLLLQEIVTYSQRLDKPLPKLFIGTDMTSNFSVHPVAHPTQDVFGTTYRKIPAPLDIDGFWQPEVFEVFDQFCDIVQKIMPITGIFLDFEMYHAQDQADNYTDLMDFSDISWSLYSKHNGAPSLPTVHERVDYLVTRKECNRYMQFLEHRAHQLGQTIKKQMRARIPNLMFGAYAQTLPLSWFYRGIMAGLSSGQEPLILATFATDFYSHAAWLEAQGIHLFHGSVIMLSKFKNPKDFALIPATYHYHDFAWYNRPSRMIYNFDEKRLAHDTVWWRTEASPLTSSLLAEEIKNATPTLKKIIGDFHE